MPIPWQALIPIGGAIIDAVSTHSANKKSFKFADRQSRTQYQRAVEDLKLAGLNPMLAVNQGGNTAATARAEPITRNTASTALAVQAQRQQFENMDAQTKLLMAQERNVREDTSLKSVTATQLAGQTQHLDLQMQKTARETELIMKQLNISTEDLRNKKLTNDQLEKMQPLILQMQMMLNRAEQLGMTEREVAEKFAAQAGSEGKWLRFIKEILK